LGWLSKEETAAVATDLGVSEREVTEMEQRLYSHDVAFDPAPAEDEEKPFSPSLYLPNPDEDPATSLETENWDEQTGKELASAIQLLDERSREILEARWLREEKLTLHELAAKFGVSAERIRQIESSAFKKMRGSISQSV